MPQKRKTTGKARKTKSNLKKGKVHIPAYKIIVLCAAIIAVCMGLLLFTTVADNKDEPVSKSIAQRFEKTEDKASEKDNKTNTAATSKKASAATAKKAEDNTKKSTKKTTDSVKPPADTKTAADTKKKSESSKTTAAKNDTSSKSEASSKTGTTSKTGASSKNAASTDSKKAGSENTKEQSQKTSSVSSKTASVSTSKSDAAAKTEKTSSSAASSTASAPATSAQTASSCNFPQAAAGAQLVLLLDDGGQNISQLKKCLDIPFPVTIAVLPQLAHSVECAQLVRNSGNELMLHQPMQALNSSVNPGPGAITPDMSQEEIRSTLFYNINQIGPVAGLNNHEGSAITADAEKMEVILKAAEAQGIFFLDSRTNVNTQVPYVCSELGYSYYERNGYFLDNEKTKANALYELRRNLDIANKNGVVIMIGHVWSADFLPDFFKEVYPELKAKGYTFTTVSKCKGRKR